jgi:hypothetical protein
MENRDNMDIRPTDFSTYTALPGGKWFIPLYMGSKNKITPIFRGLK